MRGPRRIAVVGGGVAGLAAAYRLGELAEARGEPLEVVLYEAAGRLGGPVRSVEREGYLLEEGPDSLLLEKPASRSLIERLGLAERLVAVRPEARRSWLVHRGRLVPIPEGFFLVAPAALLPLLGSPLLSWRGKLRAACEPLVPKRSSEADESVASFVERRFGRELYEAIAEPLIAGIYGSDPRDLSARATLARFVACEGTYGSVIAGIRRERLAEASAARGARYGLFASFDRGMETLVRSLASAAKRTTVRLGAPVTDLRPAGDSWRLAAGGEESSFDAVLLAAPAPAVAILLGGLDPGLAAALDAIPYRSSATLQLAYAEGGVPRLEGSGFVVPRREGGLVRGCTFHHWKYPGRAPEGRGLLRLYFADDSASLEESELVRRGRHDLERWLGVRAEPRFVHLARHERASPQYRVGHLDLVAGARAACRRHPGLGLAGSAWDGVGLADAIGGGERAAEELFSSRRGD